MAWGAWGTPSFEALNKRYYIFNNNEWKNDQWVYIRCSTVRLGVIQYYCITWWLQKSSVLRKFINTVHRPLHYYGKKCFVILNYFCIIGKDSCKVDGTRMYDKHNESYREKWCFGLMESFCGRYLQLVTMMIVY